MKKPHEYAVMIGKLFTAGCFLVIVTILILPQAFAEPLLTGSKEFNYFFLIGVVSLSVGIIGFSNYLTLKQIWGSEKFYQKVRSGACVVPVPRRVPVSRVVSARRLDEHTLVKVMR